MKKDSLRLVVFLLLTTMFWLQPIPPGWAQEAGFGEPFDDPALPNWEVHGKAHVEEGRLIMMDGDGITHLADWTELELFSQVRLTGAGEFLVRSRVGQEGEFVYLVAGSIML